MKFKTTKKAINDGYWHVISVGYCELQYLLIHEDPIAFTSGIYGWNADIYHFGRNCIVTGYRPFGNVNPEYDLVREYEEKAKRICHDEQMTKDEKRGLIYAFLLDFIDRAIEEYEAEQPERSKKGSKNNN